MNNWTMYKTVEYLINKSEVGEAFTPSDFELTLNQMSLTLFKRRLGSPEEYQLQTAFAQQGYAKTTRIMVDLSDFVVIGNLAYTKGIAPLPEKFLYPIGMELRTKDGIDCTTNDIKINNIEIIDSAELVIRKQSSLMPISKYPICYLTKGKVNVLPSTIAYSDFTYLKEPELAKFITTTNASTGELEYDDSASVELEWNDLAKLEIITLVLGAAGINLRAQEVLQVAESIKNKGL